ncbi:MAG: type II secretion system F family protein [Acidobacteriaceae bacterium]|nr:type II secretion system F family protein [Acidobacteriaceae bacterium]
MGLAAISFAAVFFLVLSVGLLLFYRQAMLQRLSEAVNPRTKKPALISSIQQAGSFLSGFVEQLNRVLPRSQNEVSLVKTRLVRAGYRSDSAVKIFYGAKILVPLLFCILAIVSGFSSYTPLFAYTLSLGLGFIAPNFWLKRQIAKRQKDIRFGLPDALDFMVICIESGLSMDQATARTAEELRMARPAISDELDLVVLDHRSGRLHSDAWKQFGDRTDVDSVRVLATILVQAEQLGTSVAKTLRVQSVTMRTKRRQHVEEQAAKTSVKLVFPLVLFIFPSIFVVLLGPLAIIMEDFSGTLFSH